MSEPKPIGTAPRDGTWILVWVDWSYFGMTWVAAHYCPKGDQGAAFYVGARDHGESEIGFGVDELEWWIPMPPAPGKLTAS